MTHSFFTNMKHIVNRNMFRNDTVFEYQGDLINVAGPWPRVKIKDLFGQYAGIDVETFEDIEKFRRAAIDKGYSIDEKSSYEVGTVGESSFSNEVKATPTGISIPKSGSFPGFLAIFSFLFVLVIFSRKNKSR